MKTIRIRYQVATILAALLSISAVAQKASVAPDATAKPTLRADELGTTNNVHSFGSILLAGQPSPEDLELAAERGIKTVITLRKTGEIDWDEAGKVNELGLDFHQFEIGPPETLTDDIFDQSLALLATSDESPVLLHCASANRVGAIWLAHRVLNDGIAVEDARKEAKTVGLRTPGYEQKALDFIERRKTQAKDASVKPGINDEFLNPQLDVSEWLGRFEIESREVYAARNRVLDACAIEPGMTVADIGAGTGFYSRLFASAVGEEGWVYAVDISPRFLEHINRQAQDDEVRNLTSVLCSDRSVQLPPESIDVAFICDTYHHFEFPQSTLASLHRALKPGGTLVVIDFERIPGESRDWILSHVRAGKETVRKEIEDAGFEFIEEVEVPVLLENYLVRFRKR